MLCISLFCTGLLLASFLNVLAGGGGDLRKNLRRSRSRCESCKKELRWWELIPVLSWILLLGKCDRCGRPIPLAHPLSELVLGIMLACGVFLPRVTVMTLVEYVFVILVFYFFAVYDINHRLVPNRYLYPIVIIVFLFRVIVSLTMFAFSALGNYIMGAAVGFMFFASVNVLSNKGLFPGVPSGKDGFGWGDAKFAVLLGLILGWPNIVVAIWTGIVAGALLGIFFIIRYRKKGMTLPFVPFLAFGSWVAMLWGHAIMDMVVDRLTY